MNSPQIMQNKTASGTRIGYGYQWKIHIFKDPQQLQKTGTLNAFLSNAVITQPQIDTVVQVLTKFVTKLKIGP